jgi:hypothetical protein
MASTEWLTPPEMLSLLGPFDIDPCAAENQPWNVAPVAYTIRDNGLIQPWIGRAWVNPPFGKGLERWVIKLAEHDNGLAIIPVRSTDTRWFHERIWASAKAICFLRGRVKYYSLNGDQGMSCPHASVVIAYGSDNARRLRQVCLNDSKSTISKLFTSGKFISLIGNNI